MARDIDDPEVMRKLMQNADLATLCLGMVSVHVTLPKGVRFHCYVMPWECMTRAMQFLEIGAVSFTMYAGDGGAYSNFDWKREPVKRARRKPRLDFVNCRGE